LEANIWNCYFLSSTTSGCVQIEIWIIHCRNQCLCRRRSRNILYNVIVLNSQTELNSCPCILMKSHFSIKINSLHMIRFMRKSIFTNHTYISALLLNMIKFNNSHWLIIHNRERLMNWNKWKRSVVSFCQSFNKGRCFT